MSTPNHDPSSRPAIGRRALLPAAILTLALTGCSPDVDASGPTLLPCQGVTTESAVGINMFGSDLTTPLPDEAAITEQINHAKEDARRIHDRLTEFSGSTDTYELEISTPELTQRVPGQGRRTVYHPFHLRIDRKDGQQDLLTIFFPNNIGTENLQIRFDGEPDIGQATVACTEDGLAYATNAADWLSILANDLSGSGDTQPVAP